MGPRHDLSFCTCTTAWVALDLLVSLGPGPHLWFLIAKQCLLVQNYKSLWVPALTCRIVHAKLAPELLVQPSSVVLCMQNGDFWARLKSLYGSQISSVALSTHNSVLSSRVTRLYWFQPSPVVLFMQYRGFRTRITSLYGSQT